LIHLKSKKDMPLKSKIPGVISSGDSNPVLPIFPTSENGRSIDNKNPVPAFRHKNRIAGS
jgi:hypothetical protein